MNITEYRNNATDTKAVCGKLSLKENYTVANADEYGYYFLGTNSCYPVTELVHPEDSEVFNEALEKLDEGMQCIIVRFKDFESKYIWMYMTIEYNGRILDGFKSIDIRFNNIVQMPDKYTQYVHNVEKYRSFLGLSSQVFYEYEYSTDIIKIYRYRSSKSIMLHTEKLSDIEKRVISNDAFERKDKSAFESFVTFIRNGVDEFSATINGALFGSEALTSGYEIKGGTIYDEDGRYLSIGVMKTTARAKKEEAYYLTEAARDSGTGLLNKRAISEYTMERLNEGNKSLYFAIMDIDDFKKVNDTYGHMFGDQVLLKVSEIIRSVIAHRGAVGRFGGDEFFILFEGIDEEAELRRILKIITRHIQWAYNGVMDDFMVTTSIGISKFPEDGREYDVLFKKADKSLYIAKAKGKNRYIIYNEEKHGKIDSAENGDRILGLQSVLSNEKKIAMVSGLILKLHEHGLDIVDEAFAKIQSYFDVDGIAIYKGNNWERVYSAGKYIEPIKNFPMEKSYAALFDENGVYAENNTKVLRVHCAKVADAIDKQETSGFVQVKLDNKDGVCALISFDIFNRSFKRSETDKSYLTILGRLICELVIDGN